MLLFEEELRYLSSRSAMLTAQQKTVAYLWQHQLSASQLKDLAQLLFTCLDLNTYASFSSKRLTERLSVDILAQALCGPSAQIGHTESGQPYLSALPVEISVSHSGNTYALSVSPRFTVYVTVLDSGFFVVVVFLSYFLLEEDFL